MRRRMHDRTADDSPGGCVNEGRLMTRWNEPGIWVWGAILLFLLILRTTVGRPAMGPVLTLVAFAGLWVAIVATRARRGPPGYDWSCRGRHETEHVHRN